jgi:hypothetical protein
MKTVTYLTTPPFGHLFNKLKGNLLAFCLLLSAFYLPPLAAQPHPYEYAQEELFLTSFGVRERYESEDCATARELIGRFHNADAKGDDNEKYKLMRAISFFQCGESYTFFENQIKKSLFETDRCHAIMFLAWMTNHEYLPVILEYAKKKKLSIEEKTAIATAFMVFGVHGAYPDLKEKSISLLDEICYDAPVDVLATCILSYFNIEGYPAIKFFNSQLEQEEFKLYAALFLAQLGEHKQTFPIFAAALSSEDNYEVHTAIMGLAAIGTDEAMQLVINLPREKTKHTLKESLLNFDFREFMKGDKL